jgi:hypothetical protein
MRAELRALMARSRRLCSAGAQGVRAPMLIAVFMIAQTVCSADPVPSKFENRGVGLIRADITAREIMYEYCVEEFPPLDHDLQPAIAAYREASAEASRRLVGRIARSPGLSARYQNEGKTVTPEDAKSIRAMMRKAGLEAFCKSYSTLLSRNTADALYKKYLAVFDQYDAISVHFIEPSGVKEAPPKNLSREP